ncbi:MAG TPA: J domain-containing protein, partial [bacterium]|nr:J domain-containing protein [bacterium]
MNNFYKILGVAPEATPEQIKDAFRKLAQQYHPDRNGSTEAAAKFKQINEAYQTLGNASKRTIYNYDLRRERERAQTGEPVPRAGKASQPANEQEYRSPAYYQNNPRAAVRPVRKTPLWLRRFGQTIQILARVLIGAALGSVLIVVHAAILGDEILFVPIEMIFGAVFGAFAGLSLPEENQLERVLKEKFKDGYKLTESVFACLAGAYFGALIADLLAFQFDLDAELTLYGVSLAGCALFGM